MSLTRQDLDKDRCRVPDCGCSRKVLKARCHPDAGMKVVYDVETGILTVQCGACSDLVVEIAVKESP